MSNYTEQDFEEGAALSVERGCGNRVKGGVYIESGLSKFGLTIYFFLQDPPIVVDANALGITPRGVKLIERNGVWHVLDWVGSEFYPNVLDFVKEVQAFGLSRRLPATMDFSKLTEDSRIILLHARASVRNPQAFYAHVARTEDKHFPCPCGKPIHRRIFDQLDGGVPAEACVQFWWEDVEGGESMGDGRTVKRSMPSFFYEARSRPQGVSPAYELAIFASFPCSRIVVVDDGEGENGKAYANHLKAAKAKVKVAMVKE
jgi:hypothetical protein